jgi:hypothetical protein
MAVRSRPPVTAARAVEEYQALVEKGDIDSPRSRELRQELEREFGVNSEELQLADLVIAKWQALRHGRGPKP